MPTKGDLRKAIVEMKYDEVTSLVQDALKTGFTPLVILENLRDGLVIVGDKYHNGEYFLSELYMAAETMKNALEIIEPLLANANEGESEGTVVIGSIQGDIHDFGKTIVSSLLTAAGFNVVDIGIDVPPSRFVDEAERVNADVIGISALLSTTQPMSKKVIEELKERGLRSKYRVILGGTGVDPNMAIEEFGLDAAVFDGSEGLRIIKSWMKEKKRRSP